MDRMQKAAVLSRLVDALREKKSWAGETHIQKGVYFLQEMLDCCLDFDFILYKHGPFSFDLRDELTSLRADEILKLDPQEGYGPRFQVTSFGEDLQRRFPKTLADHERQIRFVADVFGDRGVAELERLATALYATRELGEDSPIGKRAALLNDLKPHVPLEQAESAVLELDEVRSKALKL